MQQTTDVFIVLDRSGSMDGTKTGKIRIHPGPHSATYDIFIQSSSVNRKVVEGQQMLTL